MLWTKKLTIVICLLLAILTILSFAATAQNGDEEADSAADESSGDVDITVYLFLIALIVIIVVLVLLMTAVKIIQPYEQGLLIVLGNFKRRLNPGFNIVPPMISNVVKIDLRTQTLDVPRQEVITKDNSPTNVDAVIYIKVVEPDKSFFEVQNYKMATIYLAQTNLRAVIGDMELDEVLYSREKINHHLRDKLDEATDAWGVKVEAVEIREVDPAGPVKAAMEEQTSAERERRAAILRADGSKKSAILQAEGQKRSRILQAEGIRQSKILESDGERQARILQAQGDAQKLRILAMGAAPMDHKALTVLSLDTLAKVGDGKSTKLIFPFEFSRLLEGAAEYIGYSKKEPSRDMGSMEDLEKTVGKIDDILGPIPKVGEIRKEMKAMEEDLEEDVKEIEEIAEGVAIKTSSSTLLGTAKPAKAAVKATPSIPRTKKIPKTQ
jgi:regulator of protease activity HflC (stomatin/prohibitin superfamily)